MDEAHCHCLSLVARQLPERRNDLVVKVKACQPVGDVWRWVGQEVLVLVNLLVSAPPGDAAEPVNRRMGADSQNEGLRIGMGAYARPFPPDGFHCVLKGVFRLVRIMQQPPDRTHHALLDRPNDRVVICVLAAQEPCPFSPGEVGGRLFPSFRQPCLSPRACTMAVFNFATHFRRLPGRNRWRDYEGVVEKLRCFRRRPVGRSRANEGGGGGGN